MLNKTQILQYGKTVLDEFKNTSGSGIDKPLCEELTNTLLECERLYTKYSGLKLKTLNHLNIMQLYYEFIRILENIHNSKFNDGIERDSIMHILSDCATFYERNGYFSIDKIILILKAYGFNIDKNNLSKEDVITLIICEIISYETEYLKDISSIPISEEVDSDVNNSIYVANLSYIKTVYTILNYYIDMVNKKEYKVGIHNESKEDFVSIYKVLKDDIVMNM